MKKILIVCGSSQTSELLTNLIESHDNYSIKAVSETQEADNLIKNTDSDIIIICSPLPEKALIELAINASEKTTAGVMIICSAEDYEKISEKAERFGIYIMTKPVNKAVFCSSLRILGLTGARMHNVVTEYNRLENKIEEARLINRAKCILIQYLKLTEPQAHRYIEKQAMDKRLSKLEVAKSILTTYE
ncbi:MAG: ANTAR domain-containing protein [Ruminococcus sp.]|nr:ANTAR domain-containing protein [Ruminococcus sp.]